MNNIHHHSISDYLASVGLPPPKHPLITMVSVDASDADTEYDCPDIPQTISAGFYIISLKNVIEGQVLYGQTQYDCNSGTMLFLAPHQQFGTKGIRIKAVGRILLIHPDYLAGHALLKDINSSSFFDYAVNEALHLAPDEEALVSRVFDNIYQEYQGDYDDCSRDIILTYVKTLLSYGKRFYNRQFMQRREANNRVFDKFTEQLEEHYANSDHVTLPVLSDIASAMQISNRYLSDVLKSETGKSAKECIQLFIMERAKNRLVNTNDSITTIAYDLGFIYPQYFVRLFKKKTNMTPTGFRDSVG